MTRTIALGFIYLLVLYGIAAGAQLFARGACSAWLTTCTAAEIAPVRLVDEEQRPAPPSDLESR